MTSTKGTSDRTESTFSRRHLAIHIFPSHFSHLLWLSTFPQQENLQDGVSQDKICTYDIYLLMFSLQPSGLFLFLTMSNTTKLRWHCPCSRCLQFFGSLSTFGTFSRSHIEMSFIISVENSRQVILIDAIKRDRVSQTQVWPADE